MNAVFICDYARTPIGRFGGTLSAVRTDDLAATPIRALVSRNSTLDPSLIGEVVLGCANQAGEDNRNVARMASLLAQLPTSVPGVTVNRLCASGLEAVATAARAIAVGEYDIAIAGGVEGMSRAPFVMLKSDKPFPRKVEFEDTTIGWRFINPTIERMFGVDSMPQTAENIANDFAISRSDQDQFAVRSQQKAAKAQSSGRLSKEIVPVLVTSRAGASATVSADEHLKHDTTVDGLARLRPITIPSGSVTAGNSSGVNDGAAALLLCSEGVIARHGLVPIARVIGASSVGVQPRIMGIGPVQSTNNLLARFQLDMDMIDVIELNEAFASQALACLRGLRVEDKDPRVNPNGGAIALGHPLGMSGARLVGSAALELQLRGAAYALISMCVGVGQGASLLLGQP